MSEQYEERDHTRLPRAYRDVTARYPDVAAAHEALGAAVHAAGTLSDRERRLVKLGLAVGARQEGGVHSQVRKCLDAGVTPDEVRQVALLSVLNVGWASMVATLTWVEDVLADTGAAR